MRTALIVAGLALLLIGIAWPLLSKIPIGRLPGDIVIDRGNIKVYIPITTMILLSILLSLIAWILRR